MSVPIRTQMCGNSRSYQVRRGERGFGGVMEPPASGADSVRMRLASMVVMALVAHARRTGKLPTR